MNKTSINAGYRGQGVGYSNEEDQKDTLYPKPSTLNPIIPFLLFLLLVLSGCGKPSDIKIYHNVRIRDGQSMTIYGYAYLKGKSTLTMDPGSELRFEGVEYGFSPAGPNEIGSKIVIEDGSRLIAKGTKDKPIKFISNDWSGAVVIADNTNKSIIEYAYFDGVDIAVWGTSKPTIQRNKIENNASIYCFDSSEPLIQYNTLRENDMDAFIRSVDNSKPIIMFNNFLNGQGGFYIQKNSQPLIEHNNIMNNYKGRIGADLRSDTLIIKNNYFADNGGIPGINDQPLQIPNIIVYFLNSPVTNAGCGW